MFSELRESTHSIIPGFEYSPKLDESFHVAEGHVQSIVTKIALFPDPPLIRLLSWRKTLFEIFSDDSLGKICKLSASDNGKPTEGVVPMLVDCACKTRSRQRKTFAV